MDIPGREHPLEIDIFRTPPGSSSEVEIDIIRMPPGSSSEVAGVSSAVRFGAEGKSLLTTTASVGHTALMASKSETTSAIGCRGRRKT